MRPRTAKSILDKELRNDRAQNIDLEGEKAVRVRSEKNNEWEIDAVISGDPERIRAARKRDNLVQREDIFVDFAGTCVAHVGGRTQVD